jgi:hypothetical protein
MELLYQLSYNGTITKQRFRYYNKKRRANQLYNPGILNRHL